MYNRPQVPIRHINEKSRQPHRKAWLPGVGILVVYIDNQSIGKDVWFDNLVVDNYTSSVVEEDHYYPFGLCLNQSPMTTGVTPNNLKYQGIALEKHFGLETYETFFRGLDPQLGRFNSVDPKASLTWSISPYAAMGNNPVMFTDILGDSVNVSDLYQKNKDGSYVNPKAILAFELFASTKNGKQYLLDHAQKGFSLQGQMVEGLNIEATEEGSASANGVDVSYTLGEVEQGTNARTSYKIEGSNRKSNGGRLKTTFILPTQYSSDPIFNTTAIEETIFHTETIIHETFLHGIDFEKQFLKDYSFLTTGHLERNFKSSYLNQVGLSTLEEAQQILLGGNNTGRVSTKNMQLMIDAGHGTLPAGLITIDDICNYKAKNK